MLPIPFVWFLTGGVKQPVQAHWNSLGDLLLFRLTALDAAFDFGFGAFFRRFVEGSSGDAFGKILLFDVVVGEVVGIEVADAVAQFFAAGIVAVAQVRRYGLGTVGF